MQEKPKSKLKPKVKKIYKPLILKENVKMEDVIDDVNKSLPINFKKYKFINELHKKYPLLTKDQVALIAKTMFEVIREHLISGYSFSIKNLFHECHFFISNNKKFDFLKVKNRTTRTIRRRERNNDER